MARTQAADFEQRREAILDTAARLFASAGFASTSVADLAAACETSKSLIYHYYPSKEDILYGVMSSHIDQLVDDVAAVTAVKGAPEQLLRELVHAFMRHYLGAEARQKVLLNELDELPPERRALIVGKQKTIIDAVSTLMIAVSPTLRDRPDKIKVQTMLLFGMINWTHTWFDPAGSVSAEELADMALAMVLPRRAQRHAS